MNRKKNEHLWICEVGSSVFIQGFISPAPMAKLDYIFIDLAMNTHFEHDTTIYPPYRLKNHPMIQRDLKLAMSEFSMWMTASVLLNNQKDITF